jgi:hypothetical protein
MNLLRVPKRMPTREMLVGTLQKLEGVENVLVVVEDAEGVWLMHEGDTTLESLNWMLDRAKITIHGGCTDEEVSRSRRGGHDWPAS